MKTIKLDVVFSTYIHHTEATKWFFGNATSTILAEGKFSFSKESAPYNPQKYADLQALAVCGTRRPVTATDAQQKHLNRIFGGKRSWATKGE
jgi:hypothetical protein